MPRAGPAVVAPVEAVVQVEVGPAAALVQALRAAETALALPCRPPQKTRPQEGSKSLSLS
jgi:hypothetical protein